jgi:hypothetical protein
MVAYPLDLDGRGTMGSSVGRIVDHAGPTHGWSGAPVPWPGARLVVALLLGLSVAGCGGDQGKVDNLASPASTAPGGSSASESSVASAQGSGSGSEPGTASNKRSGSGSGSGTASGQRSSGAPGSPGGDADRTPEAAPGAPGAPTDPGGDQSAPGAPINIPAFTNRQGEPLEKLQAEIERAILSACGGTTCLDIAVEERDSNFHPSCYVGTDPPTGDTGIKVERGTRFVIVAGSDPNNEFPCVDEPSSDPNDPPPDDTSSSSDEIQPSSSS